MCDICEIEHLDIDEHPVSLDARQAYMCDWCFLQFKVNLIVKCNGCGFFGFLERTEYNLKILAETFDTPVKQFKEENTICSFTNCHKCGPKKNRADHPAGKLRFIKAH
jgi:hypothetical protein